MLYVLLMFKVICIISGNYVLGPVWAVHIEFKKKTCKLLRHKDKIDFTELMLCKHHSNRLYLICNK